MRRRSIVLVLAGVAAAGSETPPQGPAWVRDLGEALALSGVGGDQENRRGHAHFTRTCFVKRPEASGSLSITVSVPAA